MRIIVDAFGGDNAPLEILKGCEMSVKENGYEIVLSGDEEKIKSCAAENGISLENMTIINASQVVTMDDHPDCILKAKSDSSMAVGMKSLAAGEGDAFVTAGSTGAAVIGSTFLVKRIKGVKRAALATIMPNDKGGNFMVLDVGANVECRAEVLVQFGVMGSEYMKAFLCVDNPRIALLNVGTEDTKGGELQKETFSLLKNMPLNFIGNVEARDLLFGAADVVVCDGFSGNIALKSIEGTAQYLINNLKPVFKKNLGTIIAYLMLKGSLKDFKKKLDYTEIGGAPLMGIAKPVIKAHGNSKAKAFKNAIDQAAVYAKSGAIEKIADVVKKGKDTADENS